VVVERGQPLRVPDDLPVLRAEIYTQRVLFWGIMGAIVLRGIFIATAVTLLSYFTWLIYVFGAFLIYVAIKLLRAGEVHVEPGKNPVLKFFKRIFPVETEYNTQHFFVRREGKLMATALMPVMIVIASTDIMFAVDSIPAILAITRRSSRSRGTRSSCTRRTSSRSWVFGRCSSCWRGSWVCSGTCSWVFAWC